MPDRKILRKTSTGMELRVRGRIRASAPQHGWGRIVSLIPIDESLANRRILLAEDEGLIALDVESMLQTFGCEVVGPLSDLEDILRAIQAEPLDGALLDVNLRGRQVFDILPEFISRNIPVVLASGYDEADLFPQAFRGLPRISKPFDPGTLHRVCVSTIGRHSD
jgi:DNA-binding NtrC family response regulator